MFRCYHLCCPAATLAVEQDSLFLVADGAAAVQVAVAVGEQVALAELVPSTAEDSVANLPRKRKTRGLTIPVSSSHSHQPRKQH